MYKMEDLEKQDELMHRYAEEGNYQEAIECALGSLKIAEHLFLTPHGRTGVCLNNIGYLLQITGNYDEADIYYRKALDTIEKWAGTENPHLCSALDNLGVMYRDTGRLTEATPLLMRSIKIKRSVYGPFHPEVARSLNELGGLYQKQDRPDEAEKKYKEAIAAWEAMGPGADPNLEIVSPMMNLGETHRSMGNYLEAEATVFRGLEILLQAFPPDHHRAAPFFSILGVIYFGKGEYKKSLAFYNRAFDIFIRSYGENHPQALQGMKNIAVTLKTLGQFEKAEVIYVKYFAAWEQLGLMNHLDLAPVYTDLAITYEHLGEFEQAKLQHERALKIRLDSLGPDHSDVAISLENLANLCLLQGEYDEAVVLYEKARSILARPAAAGTLLPVYNYNAAANLYKNLGQYKEAEKFYKKAITHCGAALKPDPMALALVLGNTGSLYHDNHMYVKAEEYSKRALQTMADHIAADHPMNVRPLLHLAAIGVIQGNYAGTISCFEEIMSLQDRLIDVIFSFAKEEQKINFIDDLCTVYSACLSFIHKNMSTAKDTLRFGLETVSRRKGTVMDAESRSVEAILPLLEGESREAWISRSDKLSRLAQLLLGNAPEVTANTPGRKEAISRLREEIAELEGELKATGISAERALSRPTVTAAALAGALPKDTALLEFVMIRDFDFENLQDPWGLIRYIVFVLKPNGLIKLIDLGRAFDIDQTITEALHSISESIEDSDKILNRLYRLLWEPLEKSLQGINKVVVCPDGLINLAPLAALLDKTGSPLVERFTITHVTTGRDIVTAAGDIPAGDDILVLAADPDFNYREIIHLNPELSGEKGGTFWFTPLPGTLQEAAQIAPLVPGDPGQKKILLADQAAKKTILKLQNPRILHLATHGFSLPDRTDRFFPGVTGLSRGVRSLSHMGVALAGANHGDIEVGNDTGLLTILEITGMELHGTKLVVLSACNQGMGEFQTGEGIFTFRRGFALAGVKNLVMNLWPINEKYILPVMKKFYENLLHMPPAEALRQMQLQMIKELKTSEGTAGQDSWATFIIQGVEALTVPLFQ